MGRVLLCTQDRQTRLPQLPSSYLSNQGHQRASASSACPSTCLGAGRRWRRSSYITPNMLIFTHSIYNVCLALVLDSVKVVLFCIYICSTSPTLSPSVAALISSPHRSLGAPGRPAAHTPAPVAPTTSLQVVASDDDLFLLLSPRLGTVLSSTATPATPNQQQHRLCSRLFKAHLAMRAIDHVQRPKTEHRLVNATLSHRIRDEHACSLHNVAFSEVAWIEVLTPTSIVSS